MNREEAKRILAAYRPDHRDRNDPDVAAALEQAAADPVLGAWLERHLQFQSAVRSRLLQTPVPPALADRIVGKRKIVKPVFSRNYHWLAAAASIILLVGFAFYWFRPPAEDSFEIFRSRMVRTALREYRMDLHTNSMTQIQQFLSTNDAPKDDKVLDRMSDKNPIGAGLLSWQGEPVSMVCFDSGAQTTLFLFIVDRATVRHPPSPEPEFKQVNRLMTASWTDGDHAYLLAGSQGVETFRRGF